MGVSELHRTGVSSARPSIELLYSTPEFNTCVCVCLVRSSWLLCCETIQIPGNLSIIGICQPEVYL